MVLDARTSGELSFSQMDDEKQNGIALMLIFRISVISGLRIPENQSFLDELAKQIVKYITKFGFKNLTESEMEVALQINIPSRFSYPSGFSMEIIEPFGDSVNVTFFGKVLNNYMGLRWLVDRRLQNFIDGIGFIG